jgi:hypothetical protein
VQRARRSRRVTEFTSEAARSPHPVAADAQGIADRKSTMPMLANVLLRTQGKNQLLVAATDLNVSLTAELKSTTRATAGSRSGPRTSTS